MNFFGLARRSVFRKPVKSILLLLIVFAISTLLLAGVASKNQTSHRCRLSFRKKCRVPNKASS